MKQIKLAYIAPELTVVTVAAETGFADSLLVHPINIETDFNLITDYTVINSNGRNFGNPINQPSENYNNNFWNF